jgi:NAD(P)-dependent dehydrogenase (short-subunit alcohol dehydrogenase family)
MGTTPEKTVLITGANVGLGKEIARQMALRPEIARIYMACRNRDKAKPAKADLETATGRRIFDIVVMDVSDPASVRAGLADIDGSIDAVVMNAGGMGGKTPMAVTADGATYMFAQNVLGHVVLLETLLAEDRLGEVAVFARSEAARGLPKMGFKHRRLSQNPPTNSPRSSTAAISPTATLTSTWPTGRPSSSASSGWPIWPADTPTADSSA